jgi:hypothetical protein
VGYEFELAIRGKLGRLGESVIRRRTAEVERQFAEALTAVCSGRPLPPRDRGAAANRLVSPSASDRAGVATDSVPQPGESAPIAAAPVVVQRRPDWLVLGLAVAAAFAYGILVGDRVGGRK